MASVTPGYNVPASQWWAALQGAGITPQNEGQGGLTPFNGGNVAVQNGTIVSYDQNGNLTYIQGLGNASVASTGPSQLGAPGLAPNAQTVATVANVPVAAPVGSIASPVSAPVAPVPISLTSLAPATVQSPSSTASTPDASTAASADQVGAFANLIAALAANSGLSTNAAPAGTGAGTGATDTSLPPISAADVASLQPSVTPTSSTGNTGLIILLLVLVVGIGGYYLWKKHHG